jgi:hypothetical protein
MKLLQFPLMARRDVPKAWRFGKVSVRNDTAAGWYLPRSAPKLGA